MNRRKFLKSLLCIPAIAIAPKIILQEKKKAGFKLHGTSTGRITSRGPNMQQLERSWSAQTSDDILQDIKAAKLNIMYGTSKPRYFTASQKSIDQMYEEIITNGI